MSLLRSLFALGAAATILSARHSYYHFFRPVGYGIAAFESPIKHIGHCIKIAWNNISSDCKKQFIKS